MAEVRQQLLRIDQPTLVDGAAMWRIARDSGTLDLNAPYAYLLWCRDFSQTSAVARFDSGGSGYENGVGGFVTGYLRPDAPDTLMIWQVAVDAAHRGKGVASALLQVVVDRAIEQGARWLETTITSDNRASISLFSALAQSRGARLSVGGLFGDELFADSHIAEDLYRIGPFV
ncbi:diaminobutyrate acetyltransferase [Allokutzneria oryzae]|uniref:L-2,4-diaminobutyric acid acetyltransferase n=1 Tax=Allokutzneria oryzae TaxID=1378989 RepID=A0ABV5ZYZ0_9PSEU